MSEKGHFKFFCVTHKETMSAHDSFTLFVIEYQINHSITHFVTESFTIKCTKKATNSNF